MKFGGPEVMKSVNNIWKISDKGGKETQVTHHTDGNLFFPSISADGKVIVYEDNFGLWKLDTASGKSSEIVIDIKADPKENEQELVTLTDAQGFSLSPSNKRAAIIAHGELFTIATDRGEPQRVSETPWKEQEPALVAQRKVDRVRQRPHRPRRSVPLRRARQESRSRSAMRIATRAALSGRRDSKSLLWSGSDHKLRMVDVDSGQDRCRGAGRGRQRHRRAVFARRQVASPTRGRTSCCARTSG